MCGACVGSFLGSCCVSVSSRACCGSCRRSKHDVERGNGTDETNATARAADADARSMASWRGKYAVVFVVLAFLTWILRDAASPSDIGDAFGWGCAKTGATRSCGHELAVRMGLGNALFFGLMLILTAGAIESKRDSLRVRVNEGFWIVKIIVWVGACAGAWALPLDRYDSLVNFDRFFAASFLLIQLIVLLGWVYDLNDKLMSGIDDDEARGSSQSLYMLLGASTFSYGAAVTLLAFLYKLWAPSSDCSRNIAIITCMFIVCVLFSIVSLHARVNGGLFTSGAMTFYCMYLVASAMSSEPAGYECAPNTTDGDLQSILSFIGFMFGLCALGVTTLRASSHGAFVGEGEGPEDPSSRFGVSYFHFVFFTASSYCAMLFVDWTDGSSAQAAGWPSVWVKVTCGFFSGGLYLWALVAPLVLPNRDFGN